MGSHDATTEREARLVRVDADGRCRGVARAHRRMVPAARLRRLPPIRATLRPMEPGSDFQPTPGEARILRAFVVDGRIVTIPAKERKRLVVLRWLAVTAFRPGEELSEPEVNMRIALRNRDAAALRRYLVDHRFLERPGGVYRLLPETDWPPREP